MTLAKDSTVQALKYDLKLICDDTFNNGPSGWVQLIGSQYPFGVVMWDQEYAYNDSRGSLLLETGNNQVDGVNGNWGGLTAIKRLWRPPAASIQVTPIIEMEWVWYYGSQYDQNSPRTIIFGADTCDPSSDPRYFFQHRWLNWDGASGTRVTKYQLMQSDGTWVDIPGGTYIHGWNENKRDWHRTRVRFDLYNGCYDGFMIDGLGFGSLAATPDNSLRAFGPPHQTLPTFEGGLNPMFAIYNKSDAAINTHAWAGLGRMRVKAGWTP